MKTARIFKHGRSQAVRLPKEFRFKGDRVQIRKDGDSVVLSPVEQSWDRLFKSLEMFPDDFMVDREQPREQQKRRRMFP